MLNHRRVIVVFPAYNAASTLDKTYREIPHDVVDATILVDDASRDETAVRARELGVTEVIRHPRNRGYGGNQKTCYRKALEMGADIVVMVHPDYQYTPRLITAMAAMIAYGVYDVVLGSRILGRGALRGGMPLYKYAANRALTLVQNLVLGYKLTEYHTGYRAFSREVLENLPLEENSDDFVFDNQMLVQLAHFNYSIAEISCPTIYSPESSSISFWRSVRYGLGVLATSAEYRLHRLGVKRYAFLDIAGRRLEPPGVEKEAAVSKAPALSL
jgi:glycosyltransferase involved in cell wall biosynthesis